MGRALNWSADDVARHERKMARSNYPEFPDSSIRRRAPEVAPRAQAQPRPAGSQRLVIVGRLPGLNDLLDAKSRSAFVRKANGKKWNPYNALKRRWAKLIAEACEEQRIHPVAAAHFSLVWIEPNDKRDPDNVIAGKKLVLDGLVKAGILPNDGWHQVLSFTERWICKPKTAGVVVDIIAPAAADTPPEISTRRPR